jgi:hypothetical protein
MLLEFPTYPEYAYTFTVEQLNFDQGGMTINFIPANTALAAIRAVVPIRPEMDVNDLKPYLDNFAPYNRWFAQETILAHNDTLMGNR